MLGDSLQCQHRSRTVKRSCLRQTVGSCQLSQTSNQCCPGQLGCQSHHLRPDFGTELDDLLDCGENLLYSHKKMVTFQLQISLFHIRNVLGSKWDKCVRYSWCTSTKYSPNFRVIGKESYTHFIASAPTSLCIRVKK